MSISAFGDRMRQALQSISIYKRNSRLLIHERQAIIDEVQALIHMVTDTPDDLQYLQVS